MTDSEFPVQNIPQCLRDVDQWLCWKAQPDNGNVQKVPVHPESGFRVGTTDPTARTSFDFAFESFQSRKEFAGIGFIFTEDDLFAGIDLDRCLNPDGSFIWGEDIVRSFNSYTEVSPSGRGVKLFVRANKPSHARCQVDNAGPHRDGKIEVYDRARFFTVTGRVLRQYPEEVESRQPQMTSFCEKLWPPRLVPPPRDRPIQTDDAIEKRAITYLDAMPPAISGSGGHSQTYAAATVLVHGFGLTPDAALAMLLDNYNPRCAPPWTERELRHKVDDAATKPHEMPHGWLRDQTPDPKEDDVDLSSFHMSNSLEGDDEGLAPAGPKDPGPLPGRLLYVPGFIGQAMDHCLDTAPYPNQVMAFCGALALQAFLAGRRVRDPGDNRTNLYLLGLAHSAAGKDWPRKLNVRILQEVGMADCTGERFASGEGIQDALLITPTMLFQTDEIDGLLQSINKAGDARYEQLMSTLLTMYSSANSVYPMRRKAGKESPGAINQPALVVFGTAIPNHYYQALSERMLTNGLFARMLIFECGKRGKGQEPKIRDVPESILDTATWWEQFRPGVGNLASWNPVPAIVPHDAEASKLLVSAREVAESEYDKAEEVSDAVGTTVWGRVSEQTRKLALLHAVSRNHRDPIIDGHSARWAIELIEHQTRRMLFMAGSHVSRNDYDSMAKEMVRLLKNWKAKRGDASMPEWELTRRLPFRPSDHNEVIKLLESQRLVRRERSPSLTRPGFVYKLIGA